MNKIYGYVRVSSTDQNEDRQMLALQQVGVAEENIFMDGNGTIINNVYIANNTFGDAENPCDRYAVKFARRCDGTNIVINDNTVYGATTADKDFYILNLWQSGSTAYAGLNVSVNGNTINCTPDEGRVVYGAYIEATVKGSDIDVTADCGILDLSVEQ